jgi:hypothetical protein
MVVSALRWRFVTLDGMDARTIPKFKGRNTGKKNPHECFSAEKKKQILLLAATNPWTDLAVHILFDLGSRV